MKRLFTTVAVLIASAVMLTACTKCQQDRPAETPPVVEPPQGNPPPVEGAAPGDVSAAPAVEEAAPAK